MAGKNPLGKFLNKPSATSLMSFRFNPAEEDLIEEYSSDADTPFSLQNMTAFARNSETASPSSKSPAKSDLPPTKSDSTPTNLPSVVDEESNATTEESDNVFTKDCDSTVELEDPVSSSQGTANPSKESSRDASPLKESSMKEYLSKVGKRSSSLDSGWTSDQERWSLSGIKGKIVKRIEEFSQGAQDWTERHKKLKESTSNGMPSSKEDSTKGFSLRSQSSCDVRAQAEDIARSPSLEEGIDCAADDSQVPYSYHMTSAESDTTITGDPSHNTHKSVVSIASGAQGMLRKRTRQHSGPGNYTFSLSSLKATKSFESEILGNEDTDGWEFVEKHSSVEEQPEEAQMYLSGVLDGSRRASPLDSPSCETPNDASDTEQPKRTSGGHLINEVRQLWQQPQRRTRVVSVVMAFLVLQLAPIGAYSSGFLTGCLLSSVTGLFFWWLLKPPIPKKPLEIPDYSALPPLKIPSEDQIHKTSIHKGWMNELPIEYNPETYHVNSTLSVYVRLDGGHLRLSRPKTNLPRRAMWNEPKQSPVFIHQRHYRIHNASITLTPEGLAKKRLWSKKYPICLIISDSQSSQLKFKEELSKISHSEDSPEGQTILYLFARTCREKEEWFRRFLDAAGPSASACNVSVKGLPTQVPRKGSELPSPTMEDYIDIMLPMSPPIDYKSYMLSYLCADDKKESVPWLNALIGRVFFDFLSQKSWSHLVADRIQRKLSVIKVPYFMEELKLRDINLGCCMPQVQRSSEPLLDDRGLWMDFDLTYKGTFQMTLETKLNLMKLRKESAGGGVQLMPPVANREDNDMGERENRSYMYNSDEEDSAESSSDEDSSQIDAIETAADDSSSSQPSSPGSSRNSTGKKVLHWVDKIAQSRIFHQATENKYIRKAMTGVSNTPLVLTVEVHGLIGTLALNVPPPPTDRLWYGFRGNPQLLITARPKLGEHVVTMTHITDWIEKKLSLEFQKLLVMPNMDDLPIPIMDPGPLSQRRNS